MFQNKANIFSRSIQNILQATTHRQVHIQVGKDGEKMVMSTRNNIRSKREPWQRVPAMGYEPEVRKIIRIEKDQRRWADPREAKRTGQNKMASLKDKLERSGFCRDRKSYDPPENVDTRLDTIFEKVLQTTNKDFVLKDSEQKFHLLTACTAEFDHEVSNSALHLMKTVADVRNFYNTPVRGVNSYDHMVNKSDNLPKNLYVIPEAILFNHETDTFFDGVDAYPGSIAQPLGLRARKRYTQKPTVFEWPDV